MFATANFPKGSLVVLPEMFACGFSMNVSAIAEGKAQESERFLRAAAEKLGIYLMAGIVGDGDHGRGRNQAVVFDPRGNEIARYTKIQPFAPGGEAQAYEAGKSPVSFQWADCLVSPFICYDLRFPEISRPAGLAGVHLLTYIASWPEARIGHWVKLLQARAIENQCWVAGVNRIGRDPQFSYSGRSLIVNHQGEIVADAGSEAGLVQATIDTAAMEAYRRDKPFLRDIRRDFVTREVVRLN